MPRITPILVVIAGVVIVGDCVAFATTPDAAGSSRLRQAEVEHLHRAVVPHLDVGGLQVAVDDPLLVRGFERIGDLLRDRQRLVERHGAAARSDRRASVPRRVP